MRSRSVNSGAISIDAPMTASLRRLAAEFGIARDTVARRLRDGDVRPCGENRGHPIYRIRDVAPFLVDRSVYGQDGVIDPDKLPPEKRRAWFQSENERIDLELRARGLIPALEFERDMARLVGMVVQAFETLPDVLERDENLQPHQIERVQRVLDQLREKLHARIVSNEDVVKR